MYRPGRKGVIMATSVAQPPAIFALQAENLEVTPNSLVESYEEKLGADLGVAPGNVHLRSSGTTTSSGDSAEDN
jgi:hypothetical protein